MPCLRKYLTAGVAVLEFSKDFICELAVRLNLVATVKTVSGGTALPCVASCALGIISAPTEYGVVFPRIPI